MTATVSTVGESSSVVGEHLDEPEAAQTMAAALLRAVRGARGRAHGLRFAESPRGTANGDGAELPEPLCWSDLVDRAMRCAAWLEQEHSDLLAKSRTDLPPRVLLVFSTGPSFFEALFGCWLAGLVPVPVYPPQRFAARDAYAARTAQLLASCGARVVVCEERYRASCEQTVAVSEMPSTRRCSVLPDPAELSVLELALPSRRVDLEGVETRRQAPAREQGQAAANAVALVQFSSGTTSTPKPIALSHQALLTQGRLLSACWPDQPGVRQSGVSWLPLYHDMGLIGCVLPAILRQADLTLLRPETFVARPSLWLRTLSATGATVSPAPNFGYQHCLRKVQAHEIEGIDLSCWRTALNGSEPIAANTLQAFWERFASYGLRREALTPAYGLAEAGLAVTMAPLGRAPKALQIDRAAFEAGRARPTGEREVGTSEFAAQAPGNDTVELVSLGEPLDGFEIEIRGSSSDRGGEPLEQEAGETALGNVWIRGPSLLRGVLERGSQSEDFEIVAALHEGWFDTGDRGFVWRDQLYIVGRATDQVIVRGRNLAVAWLEQLIGAVPDIEAVAVIDARAHISSSQGDGSSRPSEPLPDSSSVSTSSIERNANDDGAVICVFVEARLAEDQRSPLAARVREVLTSSAGVRPRNLVLVRPGVLPRTSSGKLQRRAALLAWSRGGLRGATEL